MTRVGLTMIVKDEAHVIERCLASVRPFISWWVVCDTGSSDGTPEVVRRALAGVPGELLEREWVDFGHNRQEALDAARALPAAGDDDYVLWIDADEQLLELPEEPLELTHDGYWIRTRYHDARFVRLSIIRLHSPWRWRAPIHEYLDWPEAEIALLEQPVVVSEPSGARSRDPGTLARDSAALRAGHEADPDDPRMQFYLAQTLRGAGEDEEALAFYLMRAENPAGWGQERYYAWWQAGLLLERLGSPVEALVAYLRAYEEDSTRQEALVDLARLEREQKRPHTALLHARAATELPVPDELHALLVSTAQCTWRPWDELALASYWTGRYDDGLAAALRAVELGPDDGPEAERLRANVTWCESAIAQRDAGDDAGEQEASP